MKWRKGNITLTFFAGMFFWWAIIVLYLSLRWEGPEVYLRGLFPALPLCLLLAWGIDGVGIKSWWLRGAAGYGLNWLAQIMWRNSTDAVSITKGIRLGTDGPFVIGAMAVSWVNLLGLVIILLLREHFVSKGNRLTTASKEEGQGRDR